MDPVEHAVYRLRNAEIAPYPFPHFFATDVFPRDFYTRLRSELPPDAAYTQLSPLYKERLITDAAQAPCLRAFQSEYFLKSVANIFAPEISRLGAGFELQGELRLVRDSGGYQITPHTDAPWKMISLLFYLPADESGETHGTSLYVPKNHSKRCKGGPHWPREEFDRIYTAPYIPNACFGFWKTDHSWHGVEKIQTEIRRDVLLFNVYNKLLAQAELAPA